MRSRPPPKIGSNLSSFLLSVSSIWETAVCGEKNNLWKKATAAAASFLSSWLNRRGKGRVGCFWRFLVIVLCGGRNPAPHTLSQVLLEFGNSSHFVWIGGVLRGRGRGVGRGGRHLISHLFEAWEGRKPENIPHPACILPPFPRI